MLKELLSAPGVEMQKLFTHVVGKEDLQELSPGKHKKCEHTRPLLTRHTHTLPQESNSMATKSDAVMTIMRRVVWAMTCVTACMH